MNKYGFGCFLLGLGVGVGIGMLFAPEPGEQIRERIKSKADEGTEYLKQRGSELRNSAADLVDKGKQAASHAKEALGDAVGAGRQTFDERRG